MSGPIDRKTEAASIRDADNSGNPRKWKEAAEDRANLREKLISEDGMSPDEADAFLRKEIDD